MKEGYRIGKYRFTEDFIKERVHIDDKGCWLWKGAKHRQGYGSLKYMGKTELAHRVSWDIFNGEIPEKMKVCHRCDVTSCCNPEHLFLGTQKDNVQDAKNKERWKPGRLPRQNKLNWNQVQEIKKLHSLGMTRKELERKFEVGQTCIAKIMRGDSWNVNWTQEQ